MNSSRVTVVLLILLLSTATALRAADVVISDDISENTTWTADNTYFLDGLIFVNAGATLTIEPGTVIKGLEQANITTGDGASALIIRRQGMIMAAGTADAPIIFTSELDDVDDPFDLINDAGYPERQLWGGLIVLGEAPTSNGQLVQIEGIPVELDATYGGDDPDDNSGVITYVSIRHGGFSISGVEGDEINGLTMGAVGRGTTIHHVEVFANFDDGYEWFGGTVDTKYMIAAFIGDDGFDMDQGYRGKGQFWFGLHAPDLAGRAFEHDGCEPDFAPCSDDIFTQGIISNLTYVGSGSGASPGGDNNDFSFRLRQNAGTQLFNSVTTAVTGQVARIDGGDTEPDAVDRFRAGDLRLENNVVFDFGAGTSWDDLLRTADDAKAELVAYMDQNNQITDPMLAGIGYDVGAEELDPRPNPDSPLLGSADFTFADELSKVNDDFFDQVSYRGAFLTQNWAAGWTALDQLGFFGDLQESGVGVAVEGATELPTEVALEQNYPNPFNPSTSISFSLPETGQVRLSVHDMLGRELMVLVEDSYSAGNHSVRFDAIDLPSGMYIYRLETQEMSFAKKMLLLK
jgi:hypothetical protein